MPFREKASAAFVAVTLIAPLVAGVVLVRSAADRSPLESARMPEPLVAEVAASQRSGEVQVALTLVPGQDTAVRLEASGLVTSVPLASGSTVSTGTPVATVGDGEVVAYEAARPLHTDIGPDATGPGVMIAQQVLADLGHYRGPVDGRVRSSTLAAIVAFNKAHGYGPSTTLAQGSLAWVGSGPVVVGELALRAGEATEPGAELFTTVATPGGVKVTRQVSAGLPEGPLVLEVAGSVAELDPATLVVTEPEFLAAVRIALGGEAQGVGTVRMRDPQTVGTVPASAVVTDASGAACMFPGVDGSAVQVEPTGGTLGSVDLDAALIGRPVLVNPREVRADLDCA